MPPSPLKVEFATSVCPDAAGAVRDLRAQLTALPTSGLLFFCSAAYPLEELGRCLQETFPGVVVGCTSAGQIGPRGFQREGIAAAAISSAELSMTTHLITPLNDCRQRAEKVASKIREDRRGSKRRAFGLVLVDGLSMSEEILTAALYQSLGDVPLFGGSAGDDLKFERTFVYHDGGFLSDAATFILFETTHPFRVLKSQHFIPTDKKLVITSADPARRIVHEINGERAAIAYAELIGCAPAQLNRAIFSANPLLLKVGDEHYIRAIQGMNPDGSLTLFCAIDEGIVLTVGRSSQPIASLRRMLEQVANHKPELIIGCDCILRRLELEGSHEDEEAGALFAKNKVLGFSTYGEQFNSIHVSQSFTGVVIGG